MPPVPDPSPPERRFVVQHHQQGEHEHWDLMLEAGEVLWTWQVTAPPEQVGSRPVAATRIGDHRRLYLTYEGPLSGDRGQVRIVDRGTYDLLHHSSEWLVLEVKGNVLRGRYRLRQAAGAAWTFAAETSPR